ncbi:MAG: DUF883 C-terminal domain-containing protein [Acidobacteriota bacterium]
MSKNPNPITQPETNKTDKPDTANTGTIAGDKTASVGRFGQARQTFTRSAEKVGQGVTTIGRSVSHFASDATEYAKDNPGKALAIAVGSGVAIGYLVGASTRRRTSFWTNLATAVVGAIVDRVR